MVGDNLSTDILFGNTCGIDSCLVLSGVTNATKTEKVLKDAKRGVIEEEDGFEKEGVPTFVMSLLAQSKTIDFR